MWKCSFPSMSSTCYGNDRKKASLNPQFEDHCVMNPKASKPDTLCHLAVPRNSVQKSCEQNWWQRADLMESNPHWEEVWLTADNANQTLALIIQRLNKLYQETINSGIPEHLPLDTLRDTNISLSQIHKAHLVYWELVMNKLVWENLYFIVWQQSICSASGSNFGFLWQLASF